tara:strand:+ start:307 stop:600 length:294 start_codon:yes stop_codon:yes gene_type:complete
MSERNKFSHKINGNMYIVKYTTLLPEGTRGDCSDPREPHRIIRINSRLGHQQHMEVLLHEFSHASNWFRCEEEIAAFSEDTAAFMYRPDIAPRLGLL